MRPLFKANPQALRRVLAYVFAGLACACALVFWSSSAKLSSVVTELNDEEEVEVAAKQLPTQIQSDLSFSRQISNLDGGEVLSERITDSAGLVDEQFVSDRKSYLAAELFRAEDESVVADFIELMNHGDNYYWLKLKTIDSAAPSLVVFWGQFKTQAEFDAALQKESALWPSVIEFKRVSLGDYAGKLADYYVASEVNDYAKNAPRQIKLVQLKDQPRVVAQSSSQSSSGSETGNDQPKAESKPVRAAPKTDPNPTQETNQDELFDLIQSIE